MGGITVLITQPDGQGPFEAVAVGLPLPVVTGRTLAEVKDTVLTALLHHIDQAREAGRPEPAEGRTIDATDLARRKAWVKAGRGTVLEIPEYLLS